MKKKSLLLTKQFRHTMKPLNSFILVFLIFFSSLSSAQSFKAGIKLDNDQLTTSPEMIRSRGSLHLSSAHITGSVSYGSSFSFEARLGYNWDADYKGTEAGIFSKYYYKDVYAIGGAVFHHMNEFRDIIGNYTPETNLIMPALGIGLETGNNFAVEIMFQQGLNKKIGKTFNRAIINDGIGHPLSELFTDLHLNWVTKIGISYSFSL